MPVFGKIVVIRRNGTDGSMFPLHFEKCMFGRASDCDIRVQLPKVGDHHCLLEMKPNGTFELQQLNEDANTQVNQKPSKPQVVLKHKDVFSIFDRSFRFEYPPGSGHERRLSTKFIDDGNLRRSTPKKPLQSSNTINDGNDKSSDPFESLVLEMKKEVRNNKGSAKKVKRRSLRKSLTNKQPASANLENTPPDAVKDKKADPLRKKVAPRNTTFKITKPKHRHSIVHLGQEKTKKISKAKSRASIAKIVTHVHEIKAEVVTPESEENEEEINMSATEGVDESLVVNVSSTGNNDFDSEDQQPEEKVKKDLPVFKDNKPQQRHSVGSTKPKAKIGRTRKSIANIPYHPRKETKVEVQETEKTSENEGAPPDMDDSLVMLSTVETSEPQIEIIENVVPVFEVNKPEKRHSLGNTKSKKTANKKTRQSIANIPYHSDTKTTLQEQEDGPKNTESSPDTDNCEVFTVDITEPQEKRPLPVFEVNKPKQRHSLGNIKQDKTAAKKTRKSIAKISYHPEETQPEKSIDEASPADMDNSEVMETESAIQTDQPKRALPVFEENKPKQRHSLGNKKSNKADGKMTRQSIADIPYHPEKVNTPVSEKVLDEPSVLTTPLNESDSSIVMESTTEDVYEFNEPDNTSVTSLVKSIKKNRRRSSGNASVGRQRALHSFGSPIVLTTASPLRKSIGELRRKSVPLEEVSNEDDSSAESSEENVVEVENGTSPCKVTRQQNLIRRESLRKRVSFGPVLSPEEYLKTFPTNTPVKKGSTPNTRKSTRGSLFTPGHLATVEEGNSPANSSASSTPNRRVSPRIAAIEFKLPAQPNFKSPSTPVMKPKKKPRTPTPFRLNPSKVKDKSLLQQVLHASIPANVSLPIDNSPIANDVGASPTLTKTTAAKRRTNSPRPSPKIAKAKSPSRRSSLLRNVQLKNAHKTSANRHLRNKPLWSDIVKKSPAQKRMALKLQQKKAAVKSKTVEKVQKTPATPEGARLRHVDSPSTVYIGRKQSRMPLRTPKANTAGLPQITQPMDECFTGMNDILKTEEVDDETVEVISTNEKKQPSASKKLRSKRTKGEPVTENFGTKRLLKTPKNKNRPVTEKFGTKRLMKTPKQKSKPMQEVPLKGVARMMKTPGSTRKNVNRANHVAKEKQEPVGEHFGTKRLLQTPKDRSTKVQGDETAVNDVRHVMFSGRKKNKALNEHLGTKRLLTTPKQRTRRSKVEGLDDLRHILAEAKEKSKPVEEHFGTKRLLQTPKDRQSVKRKSTDFSGLQHMFKNKKAKYEEVKDHFGTKRLLTTPKQRSRTELDENEDLKLDVLFHEEEDVQCSIDVEVSAKVVSKTTKTKQPARSQTRKTKSVVKTVAEKKSARSTRSRQQSKVVETVVVVEEVMVETEVAEYVKEEQPVRQTRTGRNKSLRSKTSKGSTVNASEGEEAEVFSKPTAKKDEPEATTPVRSTRGRSQKRVAAKAPATKTTRNTRKAQEIPSAKVEQTAVAPTRATRGKPQEIPSAKVEQIAVAPTRATRGKTQEIPSAKEEKTAVAPTRATRGKPQEIPSAKEEQTAVAPTRGKPQEIPSAKVEQTAVAPTRATRGRASKKAKVVEKPSKTEVEVVQKSFESDTTEKKTKSLRSKSAARTTRRTRNTEVVEEEKLETATKSVSTKDRKKTKPSKKEEVVEAVPNKDKQVSEIVDTVATKQSDEDKTTSMAVKTTKKSTKATKTKQVAEKQEKPEPEKISRSTRNTKMGETVERSTRGKSKRTATEVTEPLPSAKKSKTETAKNKMTNSKKVRFDVSSSESEMESSKQKTKVSQPKRSTRSSSRTRK